MDRKGIQRSFEGQIGTESYRNRKKIRMDFNKDLKWIRRGFIRITGDHKSSLGLIGEFHQKLIEDHLSSGSFHRGS